LAQPTLRPTIRRTGLRHAVWIAPLSLLLFLDPVENAAMDHDVSSLMAALGSPRETQRAEAAERLSRLEPQQVQAAALVLVEACGDDSEAVREAAAGALEEMGPPSPELLEGLVALLSHPQADAGYWSATLLGRMETGAAAAVPVLAATLEKSPHQNVRQRAAWALGKIGPEAAPAVDALSNAAASDDPRLARLAQRALDQIKQ
jgi:HEAT repeat protein